MSLFSGVAVALVTLFNDDLSVDVVATAELAADLADRGMAGIVVAGTTGEAFTLDPAERIELVRAVRAAVPSDVSVVAGTGAPSGRQATRLTTDAFEAGADAVLAIGPASVADPRAYYAGLRTVAGDRTLLGYHFPGVSSPGIDISILDDLGLDGCKDSSGDPVRLFQEATEHATPVYVGSAVLTSLAGSLAMQGAILAVANAEPELCVRAFSGDAAALLALAPIHSASRLGPSPRGLKAALAERRGTSALTRVG